MPSRVTDQPDPLYTGYVVKNYDGSVMASGLTLWEATVLRDGDRYARTVHWTGNVVKYSGARTAGGEEAKPSR